jgi:hypothetical protein
MHPMPAVPIENQVEATRWLVAHDALQRIDIVQVQLAAKKWPHKLAVAESVERLAAVASMLLLVGTYGYYELPKLPLVLFKAVTHSTKNVAEGLAEFSTDSYDQEDPNQQYRADRLRARAEEAMATIGTVGAALAIIQLSASELGTTAEAARKATKEVDQAKSDFERLAATAESVIQGAQKAAEEQWVFGRSRAFNLAMRGYKVEAARWAYAAGGLALALIGFTSYAIFYGDGPPLPREGWTAAANISHFAPRLLVVTVLSFFMLTCVKTFRSARHNELLNGHRWRALLTFARFRDASEGNVSDAVLLQAADAIFSVQPSGFGDSGNTAVGNHVTEMLALLREGGAKD